MAEETGSSGWALDKIALPLFIGVVSSFGAWLVTWGSMSNQVQNMDDVIRELRPGLTALVTEVHDLEVTGSRGLQDFRAIANARFEGLDRVLSERDKRLSEAEGKLLLQAERQLQMSERLAEAVSMTRVNRDLARSEHEQMTKVMQQLADEVTREVINRTGTPLGGPVPNIFPKRN